MEHNKANFSITFNIYGGSNQILPSATAATQNFYGGRLEQDDSGMEAQSPRSLSPDEARLSVYINKVEDLPGYLSQVAECTSAVELARVIVNMVGREPKITPEEMVKERFLSLFLPLAPKITSGKTVDNLRARVNTLWAKRPRKK